MSKLCSNRNPEALRWRIETTFQEAREHLGGETQRQWSNLAILRTTPVLLGLAPELRQAPRTAVAPSSTVNACRNAIAAA